jgi:pimeloyl-ACP methyl ester carboxylesterase
VSGPPCGGGLGHSRALVDLDWNWTRELIYLVNVDHEQVVAYPIAGDLAFANPLAKRLVGDTGADDPIVRPEFLHRIDEYVDDLAMEYVAGAGHFVADERPQVVAQRALEFFAKP